MKLLPRRRPGPRAATARPAEPYLAAGAEQARRLGHSYVGTEHVLLVLIRNPDGGATALLRQLGVSTDTVEGDPVTDEHFLLGMLSVPDCVAARVLVEPDVR